MSSLLGSTALCAWRAEFIYLYIFLKFTCHSSHYMQFIWVACSRIKRLEFLFIYLVFIWLKIKRRKSLQEYKKIIIHSDTLCFPVCLSLSLTRCPIIKLSNSFLFPFSNQWLFLLLNAEVAIISALCYNKSLAMLNNGLQQQFNQEHTHHSSPLESKAEHMAVS